MNTVSPSLSEVNHTGPSIAFLLGASDAEAGAAFAPEMFFVRKQDKLQYALGFELARGASEATRQFTKSVNWSKDAVR